ncbi:MAG: hypothetical protein RL112_1205 [Planctomycetota bacterium]|jgi:nitroreductase
MGKSSGTGGWAKAIKGLFAPSTPGVPKKRALALDEQLRAERQATLAGLAEFQRLKTACAGTSPLLRRNVHRLEKGLCMPVRRAVFGVEYIDDTVALYARLAAQPEADATEVQWASDVLARYFAVVDVADPRIAPAHAAWSAIPRRPTGAPEHAPYPERELPNYVGAHGAPVGYPSFLALVRARRSQRWFQDKPVAPEDLEAAVAAALQAPSACNRQPFTFHCALRRDLIRDMAALPLGTAGFGADLPALACVVGDLSMYAEPRDRHLVHIDSSLAAMQFMLALTTLGLGSVPINWPDLPDNHEAMRRLLGLAPHQVPIMLIGVGHPKPDAMIPYSGKRSVAGVLRVHA